MSSNELVNTNTDNLVQAEFIGSREVAGVTGLATLLFEQLGSVQRRQFELFVEDHQTSMRRLTETFNPLSVWMDHVSRRALHITSGLEQTVEIATELSERAGHLHRRTWSLAQTPATSASNDGKAGARRGSVMDRLHVDHARLGRVLKVMETLGARLRELSETELDVLMACIDYIAEYPDVAHHPIEDRLFAGLRLLDLTAEERAHVEENAKTHEDLATATTRLTEDLGLLVISDPSSAPGMEQHLTDFLTMQRDHMRFEERMVFPLAGRLTSEQTAKIDREVADVVDPLFESRRDRYDALVHYTSEVS
jgi:hemerythrin-like domain-containing protein